MGAPFSGAIKMDTFQAFIEGIAVEMKNDGGLIDVDVFAVHGG